MYLSLSANEQPFKTNTNRPRSISQYFNMDLILSGQTSIFGGVFFVFKSLLGTDHFTVVCSVTWPLNGSEAGGDLVLIQTLLLLSCKSSCSYAN